MYNKYSRLTEIHRQHSPPCGAPRGLLVGGEAVTAGIDGGDQLGLRGARAELRAARVRECGRAKAAATLWTKGDVSACGPRLGGGTRGGIDWVSHVRLQHDARLGMTARARVSTSKRGGGGAGQRWTIRRHGLGLAAVRRRPSKGDKGVQVDFR
jgi:hypothetical protein